MMRLHYSQSRNDLHAEPVSCTCKGTPTWSFKTADQYPHKIRLAGYDDANFWNNVNAAPREASCKCGRRYRYQWLPEGVEFEWLDTTPTPAPDASPSASSAPAAVAVPSTSALATDGADRGEAG
jgi:hypothetical protein